MTEDQIVDEIIKRFDEANGKTAREVGVHFEMEGPKPVVYVEMGSNTYPIAEHTIGDLRGDDNVVEVLRWIRS